MVEFLKNNRNVRFLKDNEQKMEFLKLYFPSLTDQFKSISDYFNILNRNCDI